MKTTCPFPLLALILVAALPMSLHAVIDNQGDRAKPDPEHPLSSVPGETREQRDARMDWWRKARFGMFIHWGIYSVPAGHHNGKPVKGIGEWIMFNDKIPMAEYRAYAGQFNPVDFDAAKFVAAAKSAGMKYVIITAKHHDGFAMFDSKASDWNIVKATPYGKDPLKALAEECRRQGIRLGFYYSQAQDWNNGGAVGLSMPKGPEDDFGVWDRGQLGMMDDYIEKIALPQVRELLTNYGSDTPAVLWWDTPKHITRERAAKFNDLIQRLHPGLIQNDRLSNAKRDDGNKVFPGDTRTPEQTIPPKGYPGQDWETCMTINDSWGFKKDDNHWKSAAEIITQLVDIASKGGNYLLNVGPDSKGNIPLIASERLAQVGEWMKVNGEAIYGTTGTPFGSEFGEAVEGRDGYGFKTRVSSLHAWRATRKEGHLYLFIFEWPRNGMIKVPAYAHKITSARLLADSSVKLTVHQDSSGITVSGLGRYAPDAVATVIDLQH